MITVISGFAYAKEQKGWNASRWERKTKEMRVRKRV